MIFGPSLTRGRLLAGGPVLFLLAALLLAANVWADKPSDPEGLDAAVGTIENIRKTSPADIDALQTAYLVLVENFPRHQRGKEAIFELAHLLATNDRTSEAYAALAKIQATYQDHETMAYPGDPTQRVGIVATARIEEAALYANAMKNPYHAVDTLLQTAMRYREQNVGVSFAERAYFGRVEAIVRLKLAHFRAQVGQTNLATNDLLEVVKSCPGQNVFWEGLRQEAPAAAVRMLPRVLEKMPASLPKKVRVLDTFEQTAITETTRVWLLFARAETQIAHAMEWKNKGSFAMGGVALRQIIDKHRALELATERGAEPAGLAAMRALWRSEIAYFGNATQAGQTLETLYNRFIETKDDRLFAGYALYYLGIVELEHRKNATAAYLALSQVVDKYGDLPRLPPSADGAEKLGQVATKLAEQAHQRM
jgi:hypothetical protein